ncbi:polysaccharide pyruvyl transferase family protein [Marixanthomonas spongiae]|uniref:Polysaccharide pyruvyl transferase domain-containing protein n=1 Tax=Marixanthomonas spongiae TaxID=2174845 RepID=A0A2U0I201_9FLAO|nr:polysaccharide pyruvyl transferase family protein [Marixanthomonas spongiae]PVW15139.1 hypothetical protein DDV96_06945 [Marixanthomonas spongiae]
MNILITHGYSDSNKGDLAITMACFLIVKAKYPNSKIILHSTFREKDREAFLFHNRFMSKFDIEIKQGVLPTPYTSENKSKINDLLAVYRLTKEVVQLKLSLFSSVLGRILGGKQFQAIQDIKKSDLILIKGGQFIYNEREDLRGNLFLWRTLQPIKTAHLLKKKVIIMGQSFGGFASEKSEKIAAKYLAYCDKIFVRERVSYNFIEKYDLDFKTKVIPDLAFYLKKKIDDTLSIKLSSNKKYLGITMVNWNFPEAENPVQAKENYIKSIIETCIYAHENYGLTPIFIPQVTVKHHGESDIDIIKTVNKALISKNVKVEFYTKDLSVYEMMALYKKCELLIGTRLHSCILAASVATPILPIRYQGFKTQGVVDELGQKNLLLDIHNLTAKELIDNVDFIIENKVEIRKTLNNRTDRFIEKFNEINLEVNKLD